MEFRILGPMEVLDGTRRVDLPAGRGRVLLALLVLHASEAVTAERLIDELWGEHPPATAGTVVQGLVSRLRKELEPGRGKGEPPALLQTVGSGYRLAIEAEEVDADRLKRLLDEARGAALEVRSAMLADGLGLWHGPALADFTYEPSRSERSTRWKSFGWWRSRNASRPASRWGEGATSSPSSSSSSERILSENACAAC